MNERDRKLWLAIRRGILLIAAAIDREDCGPFMIEVRRGLLLITAAIEAAAAATDA